MKRLLSLILALLFCLSFIVSCEKEEAPSSSSSEKTDENLGLIMTEGKVDYYPHISYEVKNLATSQIKMALSKEELSSILQGFGINAEIGVEKIPSQNFENCYIFVLANKYVNPLKGYRSVAKTDEGYLIIADRYFLYDGYSISEDGKRIYELAVPIDGYNNEQRYNACDVLIIPKSEFDTPPTAESIQIHNVIYNFTK